MRYRLRIALLAMGTVAGFTAGFESLLCRHHAERRAAFERHVARVCIDAADHHRRGPR